MMYPVVSITPTAGKIWQVEPDSSTSNGHIISISPPSSLVKADVRPSPYTSAVISSDGTYLTAVDRRGHVISFNLKANRYVKLDKAGSPALAATYSNKTLFVAFQDSSIRAYDIVKSTSLGVMKEHRTAPFHLAVRGSRGQLLSTSQDAVILWDIKKLQRRRSLGGGPHGALLAVFTADEHHIVAGFRDGSFHMWDADTGAPARSFMLPPSALPEGVSGHHVLCSQGLGATTFAVSRDSQLVVAGGAHLPALLVFSLVSGSLLYSLDLPPCTSGIARGARQLHFLPGPPPRLQQHYMQEHMHGAQGLSEYGLVLLLTADGAVLLIDVVIGAVLAQVCGPSAYQDTSARVWPSMCFSLDAAAKNLALTVDGIVHLYHLPSACKARPWYRRLIKVPGQHVKLSTGLAQELMPTLDTSTVNTAQQDTCTSQNVGIDDCSLEASQQEHRMRGSTEQGVGSITHTCVPVGGPRKPPPPASSIQSLMQHGTGDDGRSRLGLADVTNRSSVRFQGGQMSGVGVAPGSVPISAMAVAGSSGGFVGGVTGGPAGPLQRAKLKDLLDKFGEYPAKYRLMIWCHLLRLPQNKLAYQGLTNRGKHPAYEALHRSLPVTSKALTDRLSQTLSQLAHWCPVFGQAGFVPSLVFPFVKLCVSSSLPASNEACFELLATLLIHWTRGWFERFPDPPVRLLSRLDALLAFHDAPLADHLRRTVAPGGVASLSWRLLQDAASSALIQGDWLKVWDHCITAGPDYLYYWAVAYFIHLRSQLLEQDTGSSVMTYLAQPPGVNCTRILKAAYSLKRRTPPDLAPVDADSLRWEPLPTTGDYTQFRDYPPAAVELFDQERKRIAEAEEALARRRRVVSELQLRSTSMSLAADSLSQERQALAQLQQSRREALRQLDSAMLDQAQRLDDKAKEERLRQVATLERCQAVALADMRREWQRELSSLQQEVADRKAMLGSQLARQAESEAIAQLEFTAGQKMADLQAQAAKEATLSKMRDEARAHVAELSALQQKTAVQWEEEERQRQIMAQHEADRQRRVALASEDAAAQAAIKSEMIATRLALQEQLDKVESERRLRAMAEEQAALSRAAEQQEAHKVVVAAAAQAKALELQSQIDASWYTAEKQRRAAVLSQQQLDLDRAQRQAKEQLEEAEMQIRLLSSQATLLDKRRALELLNADEELQVRRMLDSLQTEQVRALKVAEELARKKQELDDCLQAARNIAPSQPPATALATGGAARPHSHPYVGPQTRDTAVKAPTMSTADAGVLPVSQQHNVRHGPPRSGVEDVAAVRHEQQQQEVQRTAMASILAGSDLADQAPQHTTALASAPTGSTPVDMHQGGEPLHPGRAQEVRDSVLFPPPRVMARPNVVRDLPDSPSSIASEVPSSLPATPAAALALLTALTADLDKDDQVKAAGSRRNRPAVADRRGTAGVQAAAVIQRQPWEGHGAEKMFVGKYNAPAVLHDDTAVYGVGDMQVPYAAVPAAAGLASRRRSSGSSVASSAAVGSSLSSLSGSRSASSSQQQLHDLLRPGLMSLRGDTDSRRRASDDALACGVLPAAMTDVERPAMMLGVTATNRDTSLAVVKQTDRLVDSDMVTPGVNVRHRSSKSSSSSSSRKDSFSAGDSETPTTGAYESALRAIAARYADDGDDDLATPAGMVHLHSQARSTGLAASGLSSADGNAMYGRQRAAVSATASASASRCTTVSASTSSTAAGTAARATDATPSSKPTAMSHHHADNDGAPMAGLVAGVTPAGHTSASMMHLGTDTFLVSVRNPLYLSSPATSQDTVTGSATAGGTPPIAPPPAAAAAQVGGTKLGMGLLRGPTGKLINLARHPDQQQPQQSGMATSQTDDGNNTSIGGREAVVVHSQSSTGVIDMQDLLRQLVARDTAGAPVEHGGPQADDADDARLMSTTRHPPSHRLSSVPSFAPSTGVAAGALPPRRPSSEHHDVVHQVAASQSEPRAMSAAVGGANSHRSSSHSHVPPTRNSSRSSTASGRPSVVSSSKVMSEADGRYGADGLSMDQTQKTASVQPLAGEATLVHPVVIPLATLASQPTALQAVGPSGGRQQQQRSGAGAMRYRAAPDLDTPAALSAVAGMLQQATPSSLGEVSDIDALIERIKNSLDWSETEDDRSIHHQGQPTPPLQPLQSNHLASATAQDSLTTLQPMTALPADVAPLMGAGDHLQVQADADEISKGQERTMMIRSESDAGVTAPRAPSYAAPLPAIRSFPDLDQQADPVDTSHSGVDDINEVNSQKETEVQRDIVEPQRTPSPSLLSEAAGAEAAALLMNNVSGTDREVEGAHVDAAEADERAQAETNGVRTQSPIPKPLSLGSLSSLSSISDSGLIGQSYHELGSDSDDGNSD